MQEEMQQVLEYHKWKAVWWHTRGTLQTHDDASILSGVSGYAHKQAMISLRLATQCACYWLLGLESKGITPSWAAEYPDFADPSRSCSCIGQCDGDSDNTNMGMEADIDLDNDEEVEHYEMSDEEYFSDVDVDSQEI